MNKKICKKCGSELNAEDGYCSECGTRYEGDKAENLEQSRKTDSVRETSKSKYVLIWLLSLVTVVLVAVITIFAVKTFQKNNEDEKTAALLSQIEELNNQVIELSQKSGDSAREEEEIRTEREDNSTTQEKLAEAEEPSLEPENTVEEEVATGAEEPSLESENTVEEEVVTDTGEPTPEPELSFAEEEIKAIAEADVGDVVGFGDYAGEKRWRILEKEDKKVFLLSYKLVDKRPFDSRGHDMIYSEQEHFEISWEKSELREWLNSVYLEKAFSEEEREYILYSDVPASGNEYWDVDGGKDTVDQIFILSREEILNYFPEETDRIVKYLQSSDGFSWWTRTMHRQGTNWTKNYYFEYITSNGYLPELRAKTASGITFDTWDERGVRPAMWLDISSVK